MDDREFERKIEQLMKTDFSAGTEKFRDALLARCLDVLDTDDECSDLDDEYLDLLAAAGDPFAFPPNSNTPEQ